MFLRSFGRQLLRAPSSSSSFLSANVSRAAARSVSQAAVYRNSLFCGSRALARHHHHHAGCGCSGSASRLTTKRGSTAAGTVASEISAAAAAAGAAAGIPRMQMGAVITKHGSPEEVEFKQIPVPEPGPGEVLVNIKFTGVCHTDLHALHGDWPLPAKMPLVGGHEGAGYVVKVGDGVTDVKLGDRVGIKWMNGSCGKCEYCLSARESLCPHILLSGYSVDGTFQHYAIGKADHVTPIPDNVSLEVAAPIMCAGITVYRALKEAAVQPNQWVVLPGAGGGLGHLAIQYARAMSMRVVAIDSGADKEKLCRDCGADVFIDFRKEADVVAKVKEVTGGGAHGTLVLSTSSKSYQQATEFSRPGSTLVTVSMPPDAQLNADIFWLTVKMLKICGSHVGNRLDSIEALQYVSSGAVKPVYKVQPFSTLPQVYSAMEAGNIAGRIVLDLSL
ncbi:alcohol dehydrogenase Adh1 [Schizosaccharomyces japonicus yFS275]|uniref:alcohol dehydrogenase n=1 Tax=Schizosaccharomyces japonicus (strain yFS275 / FY16936) TaxID=402676 RepID=B6K3K6_SCHJY|nr:alcohol dehydrogenase Adh1 [Schizosaccharomyces japonicus yFS275]EEB08063.2 alcohol dehydrogenase Adh1 [Schizosaccharomyces japonicus yFS275]